MPKDIAPQGDDSLLLSFRQGTLLASSIPPTLAAACPYFQWDERTALWRAPAWRYRDIISQCHSLGIPYHDQARSYEPLPLRLQQAITPRPHQADALQQWEENKGLGTVVLPTGAGKTVLALMAMAKVKRPTLVVVPTLDLVQQWEQVINQAFGIQVGILGGGQHNPQAVTVATYDSAHMHIERLGQRFAFLIFDECHHLPAPAYQLIALASLAPFRLGLSATVERVDGLESFVYEHVGPKVFEGEVQALVGAGLAPYTVVTREIPMSEEELELYRQHREIYLGFVRSERLNVASPDGWRAFIMRAARSPRGRQAMQSYRLQKQLAQASENKLTALWDIIQEHVFERMIIFTNDNALAYRIGKTFILPVLTHQTKLKERKRMLESFRAGQLRILVTSKVLNEGVDVPEASIGVIVSGSGAVREHVQRLGRILRGQKGKKATLYELVSKDTSEYFVNQRRREHHAYRGEQHANQRPG